MPYLVFDPLVAAPAPAVTFGAPLTTGSARTLLQTYQELILRIGDRTDVTYTRAKSWINDAYRDLATSLDLPELKAGFSFSTVTGQPFYNLPTGVRSVQYMSISDPTGYPSDSGREIFFTDNDTYRRYSEMAGFPERYALQNDVLALWPTPDSMQTVVVDIEIELQDMTADDHKPRLKADWNEALVILSTAKAHYSLMEPELAMVCENEYVNYMRRRRPKDTAPQRVSQMKPIRSQKELFRDRSVISTERRDEY